LLFDGQVDDVQAAPTMIRGLVVVTSFVEADSRMHVTSFE
jgi:hypothetical protein